MELIKHTHATVVLRDGDRTLLIDPGAYTPNSAELVAATDTVLVTHDHPDHLDPEMLSAALDARPELRVWAPAAVVATVGEHDGRVTTVSPGDAFSAGGFDVTVFGGDHAVIHADLGPMSNVGYLVDGTVFHPGDSYEAPGVPIETLLVPTSGPWAKLGELVDFMRAVAPARAVQIHDLMLSEVGKQSFAQFAGQLTGMELLTLADGETITV